MPTLLERAQREGTPLIDDSRATFVWLGAGEIPQLIGDFNAWGQNPITLSEIEPHVWAYTLLLPLDAYVEYQFVIPYDITESFRDPLNPRIVYNGVDSVNHYFTMPEYQAPALIHRQPGVQRGQISEHWLETGQFTGDTHRKVYLYHPPVEEPTPLVVVWDGSEYLFRGHLNVIVDNLIAAGRIQPLSLLFIDNGQRARYLEYMQAESTLGLLTQVILPFASQHLNLIAASGSHGLLGSSMGGLMALYAGLRLPDLFGHVLCQSGAFWFRDPRHPMLIVDYIQSRPTIPIKIWQDVGTLELLLDANRKMNALLKGYDVTYREFHGGHNHTLWSDNTWRGLEALYGK